MSALGDRLLERAMPQLQTCGHCDAGLPMNCTCPNEDPRRTLEALIGLADEHEAAALTLSAQGKGPHAAAALRYVANRFRSGPCARLLFDLANEAES